ncbi:Rqc2 family fibronectin-binding protein [Blautia hydrogenotrophica]|uniref:Rqc2 homolog RqcH n=1 Tax=Blautia hydrogenotrophica (strain DSM 10507 / JCM 14656 / S5a33) TaxID=476272 RepID=C0CLV1_BLAHS|nr:NFACT RNA binding domain-containing protein [Blautia hydrogenotrophica]SCI33057.1 Fibronectin-binding protein A N-terminus (FbpA) [uncultured Blautia sp.]EEG49244.1 fibronectin-binding protein A domain protein [Blautia hydrogenotrophica DSM 10507]MCT6798193.1 NFACT family protein [Blautia hydrogenotrophica]MEE0462917.1 NFACT RNA binding domain-containing protein [Blautia hydrogenotrophica]WPX84115.1 Rqc2 RqcH [Blautia hydrogenotrophica DSM 10507]
MAFDGITIAAMVKELNDYLAGGRINKIAQPETDELLLTCRGPKGNCRLLLSASASLPLIYFTQKNKPSPLTAPNFCMLLRKHLSSARFLSITQPSLERVIRFELEHLNELGDLCRKYLIIEIMGKHSNIIFCDEDYKILDSIKHVSSHMSSVREVLPGRQYFIPQTQEKLNPWNLTEETFHTQVLSKPTQIARALYTSLTGISPVMAHEICTRASLDGDEPTETLDENSKLHLYGTLNRILDQVKEGDFHPNIIFRDQIPVEYSVLPMSQYQTGHTTKGYPSVSSMLEQYYAQKNIVTRIRQKSSDLRRIVQTALERNSKKYSLQLKQLKDTGKKEKYKVYGELINTYGYGLEDGCKSFQALNYYTNEEIAVPLDPSLSPQANAKKYFEKYAKLKRTEDALTTQIAETKEEIQHLESISASLDIALNESDLVQIKEELTQYGYIKKHSIGKKKTSVKSKPFHYLSSDGYHIYVGKNNYQNDELTFKFATGNDWWFHAKGTAGSHVIVKSSDEELPDRVFEEAGSLAAYYSKGRTAPKVEIDYIQKKHVKKPNGSKPGFVVYYTNYSLMAVPDIQTLTLIDD